MMKKMHLKHERLDLTGGNCLKLVLCTRTLVQNKWKNNSEERLGIKYKT